MKGLPEKIYLQISDDDGTPEFFHELDTTWCSERINKSDIEYTLTPTS